MKRQKGFTIIELLTVITIIGILAAVILGALGDARNEGIGAKIISEMDAISKRAEIESVTTGTYDAVCGSNGFATSTVIAGIIDSINSLASSTLVCNSTTSEYAMSAPVQAVHWCIDSTGQRKEIGAELGGGVFVCP
tara:strand:+ start:266 stop:676 length:411 start_codon:yes stop_codon:yes gene_type:complete